MTHFLKVRFPALRPLGIQNVSLMVVKVSLIPLCFILECTSWIMSLAKWCLDGSKTGFLLGCEIGAYNVYSSLASDDSLIVHEQT